MLREGDLHVAQCARVWNLMKPHAICGFAVSRAAAEALLAEQPLGSFLVRLCSEPGAFAISCCMEGPGSRPYVDHLLVDAVDLQGRTLEHWVHAHQFATQLLDPLSDKVYPKVPPLNLRISWHRLLRSSDAYFWLIRIALRSSWWRQK